MSYTVEHVEISFDVGEAAHMQVVAKAPFKAFHPDLAAAHGFVASDDGWNREVTDDIISNEIARTQWCDPDDPRSVKRHVTGWKRSGKLA